MSSIRSRHIETFSCLAIYRDVDGEGETYRATVETPSINRVLNKTLAF